MRSFRKHSIEAAVLVLMTFVVVSKPETLEPGPTPLQSLFMIKGLIPQVQIVGIMWNDQRADTQDLLPKIDRASATVGVKVVVENVRELAEISQKFRDLTSNYHVQVLWVVENDEITGSSLARDFLIKNTTVNGIALFAPGKDWVSAGACAALQSDGGTVKLFVNQKTISALGIKVPEKFIPNTQFLATN